MKVLFAFGPNLGALGRRAPEVYGTTTLEEVMTGVLSAAADAGHDVVWRQSDHEGDLVSWCNDAPGEGIEAIVINPGALTHYSFALRDAIEGCGVPAIEVHQTQVHAREEFRRRSVVSEVCRATITGVGVGGYHLALEALPWIIS
jgi:3-dehydroquinate dehydratase-2